MASKYGHGSGDISSFYRAAPAGFVPKSAISKTSRSGQRKNGRSGEKILSVIGRAWAVLGGIPSGWGQFGAVKKLLLFIGGLRRQLNALYLTHQEAREAIIKRAAVMAKHKHSIKARGLCWCYIGCRCRSQATGAMGYEL